MQKIPMGMITIFVASEEEKKKYLEVLGSVWTIVVGVPGLGSQRLFIRNFFPEETRILTLDDDIKSIKFLKEISLLELARRMFLITEKEKVSTWGIYPVDNLYFCNDRVVKGNFYIVGCCYGFINKHDITEWSSTVGVKEDCWYSLKRIVLDGAVIRYDGCCPHTTYYARGGLYDQRNTQIEQLQSHLIVDQFPTLATFKLKKNGHPEVKIRRKILKTLQFLSEPPTDETL
jgi:hypothetical protein